MQQYFVNQILHIDDTYVFTKQQAHHAKTVVRLDHEVVRLVDEQHHGYFALAQNENGQFVAKVFEKDEQFNELPIKITLCMALIRKEKFELVLQKATELGVYQIVPVLTKRCIIKLDEKKQDRKKDRYQDLLLEASQQCKRNIVPLIQDVCTLQNIQPYLSEQNVCAYESIKEEGMHLRDCFQNRNITIIIGPEGGFEPAEIAFLESLNCQPISLGNRILRAETAAMYAISVLGELCQ